LVPEKKARYLMPVLIPLAINTGFYIEYLVRNFKTIKDKRETIPVYFNFGLIACIGILFPAVGFILGSFLTGEMLLWFILASVILVTVGVLIIINLKKKNINQVFYLCIAFIASVLITVVPLSKFQIGPNYNPILDLKEDATEQGLKVYSLDNIAPEMIWQYGDKAPSIKDDNGSIQFPKESRFGLLINDLKPEIRTLLETEYFLEKKETYDLNYSNPDSKKYNQRLLSDYYILTKK